MLLQLLTGTVLWAGGDWGAMISKALGVLYPQSCIALHLNSSFAVPDWYNPMHALQYLNATYFPSTPLFLSKDEITAHQWVLNFLKTGNGEACCCCSPSKHPFCVSLSCSPSWKGTDLHVACTLAGKTCLDPQPDKFYFPQATTPFRAQGRKRSRMQ